MGSKAIGVVAMVTGGLGMGIPILVLAGNSQPEVQVGVMISGSVVFGCGVIATAIGLKK